MERFNFFRKFTVHVDIGVWTVLLLLLVRRTHDHLMLEQRVNLHLVDVATNIVDIVYVRLSLHIYVWRLKVKVVEEKRRSAHRRVVQRRCRVFPLALATTTAVASWRQAVQKGWGSSRRGIGRTGNWHVLIGVIACGHREGHVTSRVKVGC